MEQKIKETILEELKFIEANQSENGGFLSLSFSETNDLSNTASSETTFHISLILSCLDSLSLKNELIKNIRDRGLMFLLKEKSGIFSWNYWQRNSLDSKRCPCPDDLDDTFAALGCIQKHSPETIDEKAMVDIIRLLISCEEKPGGPYHTWIVESTERASWEDIDIVVNANIMNFLTRQEIQLPNLLEYFETAIQKEDFRSKYYQSPIVVIYFIAKWYQGPHINTLREKILRLQTPQGTWGNILETSLAVSAFLKLKGDPKEVESAIVFIADNIANNHTPYPLYVEEIRKSETTKKNIWSGSACLTSSYAVEALSLYEKASAEDSSVSVNDSAENAKYATIVVSLTKNIFKTSSEMMRRQLDLQMENILTQDTRHEVTLLPFFFYKGLYQDFKYDQASRDVFDLGVANLLGWIGYGIYDGILDHEIESSFLSLANRCVQETRSLLEAVFSESSRTILDTTLKGISEATLWESSSCYLKEISGVFTIPESLPDYGNYEVLAQKSLGHALGCMALGLTIHCSRKVELVEHIRMFFTHYLIARQLNDDAHDWFSDFQKGFLNPVTVLLFKKLKQKQPSRIEIDLTKDEGLLKSIFWNEVIDSVTPLIKNHVAISKKHLDEITVLKDKRYFCNLLDRIEKSAEEAVKGRNQTLKFLNAYE